MRIAPLVVLAAGCSQILGIGSFQASGTDAPGVASDALGPDAPPPPMLDCNDLGSAFAGSVNYNQSIPFGRFACMELGSSSLTDVTIDAPTTTFDTDAMIANDVAVTANTSNGTIGLKVIVATKFTLGPSSQLEISGSNAVVILASGPIDIEGTMTTSTSANDDLCVINDGSAGGGSGGGGGGGGGFQGSGGAGGGDSGGYSVSGSPPLTAVAFPFGGCPGGVGGGGNGARSLAGGGIYLVSQTSVVIGDQGGVNAGGSGGHAGALARSGGGGGASGGTIILESESVVVGSGAILAANGGGGASGTGSANDGVDGLGGELGSSFALGAANTNFPNEGVGGDGGANTSIDGSAGNEGARYAEGGAGGGGAVGFIFIRAVNKMVLGTTSPPVSP